MRYTRRRNSSYPTIIRLWDSIPTEFKTRIRSYSWSASSHFVAIVVLFICTIEIESKQRLVLEIGFAAEFDDTALILESIEAPESLVEPIEQIVETSAPAELPEISAMPNLSQLLAESLQPVGSMDAASAAASSLSTDVDASDSRLVEVNRRVKAAGGDLDGPIRVSLMWESNDDLDLHLNYTSIVRPNPRMPFVDSGYLWFGQPATTHARLDVDANARFIVQHPCENIIFKTIPKKAKYVIALHLYAWRSGKKQVPYTLMVHYGKKSKLFEGTLSGIQPMKQIHTFTHP